MLCGTSNRQCGCVILIKKNDKCGEKIRVWDLLLKMKDGAGAAKNKREHLDLLNDIYLKRKGGGGGNFATHLYKAISSNFGQKSIFHLSISKL